MFGCLRDAAGVAVAGYRQVAAEYAGRRVAIALEQVGIVCNFNTVPNARPNQKPLFPDGVRLGTPCVTSRGMKAEDMAVIADFVDRCCALVKRGKIEKGTGIWADKAASMALRNEVFAFTSRFPTFTYE